MFKSIKRTSFFRCKKIESGRIENSPLNEVLPPFEKWKEETKYCDRGLQFGTLEFRFQDEGTTYVASMFVIETEKWVFYPVYMGKRTAELRIYGVPLEWLVSAVLENSEEAYNILTFRGTDTLN